MVIIVDVKIKGIEGGESVTVDEAIRGALVVLNGIKVTLNIDEICLQVFGVYFKREGHCFSKLIILILYFRF